MSWLIPRTERWDQRSEVGTGFVGYPQSVILYLVVVILHVGEVKATSWTSHGRHVEQEILEQKTRNKVLQHLKIK